MSAMQYQDPIQQKAQHIVFVTLNEARRIIADTSDPEILRQALRMAADYRSTKSIQRLMRKRLRALERAIAVAGI